MITKDSGGNINEPPIKSLCDVAVGFPCRKTTSPTELCESWFKTEEMTTGLSGSETLKHRHRR